MGRFWAPGSGGVYPGFTGTITPERFGALGNGVADDFAAWENMVEAVNAAGSGTVQLRPNATYYLGQYITASNGVTQPEFSTLSRIAIIGNGAVIDIKGDIHRDVTTTRPLAGIALTDCANVIIRNLTIDGNVDLMTREVGLAEVNAHLLRLFSCTNIDLSDLDLHHGCADGLYFGNSNNSSPRVPCRNVTASRVKCRYNARQGMSAVQLRTGTFDTCEFTYTQQSAGTYGGHSPGAGVDVEPNYGTTTANPNNMTENTGDLSFVNCTFKENIGPQIVTGGSALYDTVTMSGCTIDVGESGSSGAGGNAAFILGCDGLLVADCTIICGDYVGYLWPNTSNRSGSMAFRNNSVSAANGAFITLNNNPSGMIDIHDNEFNGVGTGGYTGTALLYLTTAGSADVRFRNNTVNIAGAMYTDDGAGDYCVINSLTNVALSEGNSFTTNLLASSGSEGKAHFANNYGASTVVVNDTYAGTAPGPADTIRPVYNGSHDTTQPYSKN